MPKLEFIGNVLHRGLSFHHEYRVVTQPTPNAEDDSLGQDDYQPTDDDLNEQIQEIVKILL